MKTWADPLKFLVQLAEWVGFGNGVSLTFIMDPEAFVNERLHSTLDYIKYVVFTHAVTTPDSGCPLGTCSCDASVHEESSCSSCGSQVMFCNSCQTACGHCSCYTSDEDTNGYRDDDEDDDDDDDNDGDDGEGGNGGEDNRNQNKDNREGGSN